MAKVVVMANTVEPAAKVETSPYMICHQDSTTSGTVGLGLGTKIKFDIPSAR